MNTREDCEWLRSTHLRAIAAPDFESFKLTGNEDSPSAVELYAARKPEYNDQPVATYTNNDAGELEGPPKTVTKVIRRTRKGA